VQRQRGAWGRLVEGLFARQRRVSAAIALGEHYPAALAVSLALVRLVRLGLVCVREAHGGSWGGVRRGKRERSVLSAQAQVLCGLEAARGVGDGQREAEAEAEAEAKGAATNFTDMAGYGLATGWLRARARQY
jgi:hypothetical protein